MEVAGRVVDAEWVDAELGKSASKVRELEEDVEAERAKTRAAQAACSEAQDDAAKVCIPHTMWDGFVTCVCYAGAAQCI